MILIIIGMAGGYVAAWVVWVVYCAFVLAGRASREEEAKALKGDSND